MNIEITENTTLAEIQSAFSDAFPFLKLVFFRNRFIPSVTVGIARKKQPDPSKTNSIELLPSMSVEDLEANFLEDFNLPVQVYRKSGVLWLETSITSHWSLGQQNLHGQEISEPSAESG